VGAGSTVNFAAQQIIGNTTNITLCDPNGTTCPVSGEEFAILSRSTDQQVVIDVQGYYYEAVGSCPDDMVANGDGCIDKYEASVWSTSTGDAGTQVSPAGPGGGSPNIVCDTDGTDCGANAANPIYARSEAGFLPAGHISWYQAAQACANVGKRLPTTAEWQTAALGTPPGDGGGCNITSGGSTPSLSGANDATCASPAGAFDMIGNVWEMTAELDLPTTAAAGTVLSSDTLIGRSFGDDFSSTGDATTTTMFPVAPNTTNGKVGFRCVR
jgi:formylglycine-generating enzyme required for sulfatase activity